MISVRDFTLAVCVMAIWGISFSVVKIGLAELPPLLFIGLRFLIVAVPAVFFIPFPKTRLRNVIAVGLLIGVVKFGLLFLALQDQANAGVSALILQSQVFFTVFLSAWWLRERVTRQQTMGLVLALLGFGAFFVSSGENITYTGLGLLTAAGLAWALSNLVMKRMPAVNLLHFMVWVSLVPPVPLLLLSYGLESQDPLSILESLSHVGWLSLLYMGYLSTLLAYALWGHLLSAYAAASVAPFALLIPIFGMLTSMMWLHERLSGLELIGTIIVLIGLGLCIFQRKSAVAKTGHV